jgi:hypothetical protein
MDSAQTYRAFTRARDLRLADLHYDGTYKLTRGGRDFLDMVDFLRSIDDRAGAASSSSPLAAGSEQAAPQRGGTPRGTRQGDDRPTARGARSKRT